MPQNVNYEKYQNQVNEFNQKYGVKFSYEEFESNILKMRNFKRNFNFESKDMTMEDSIYRGTFSNLYKQSAHSFIDKKIKNFSYADFLQDYEALIANYRIECEKTGYPKPSVRGGWTKDSDVLESVNKKIADVKDKTQDDVEDRYEKRELRIRDMRAYAEQLRDSGETSVEKISALFVYANALESYNKKRNFFSRTFGTQGRAERNNANNIRAIANALIGDDRTRQRELDNILALKSGTAFKVDVSTALKDALKNEKIAEERRQIEIVNDKQPAELRDFLEIGYRPNLAALDEEWNIVAPFYDDVVKQNKYWSGNTFEDRMKREIFQKNYIRLQLMREAVRKYGGGTPKFAVDLYNKTEVAWAMEDNQLKNNYPDYTPKIPAGYGENHIQNDNVKEPQVLDNNESCKTQYDNIVADEGFESAFEEELWNSIKAYVGSSVKKEDVIDGIYEKMLQAAESVNEIYDELETKNASQEDKVDNIHESLHSIYYNAFSSLDVCQMDITNQVVAAQKISDIIINKLTPVAFNKAALSKYSNNYAINDKNIVPEILQSSGKGLNEDKIDAIMKKAKSDVNKSAPKSVNNVQKESISINMTENSSQKEQKANESVNLTAAQRYDRLTFSITFKRNMLSEIKAIVKGEADVSDIDESASATYVELMEESKQQSEDFDNYQNEYKKLDENEKNQKLNEKMQDNAKEMFSRAYSLLDYFDISLDRKPVVAQKMADLFLNSATPVGFYPEKYGQFGINYAIKDSKFAMETMSKSEFALNKTDAKMIIDDCVKELGSREKVIINKNDIGDSAKSNNVSNKREEKTSFKGFTFKK